jgi:hypothetical protein
MRLMRRLLVIALVATGAVVVSTHSANAVGDYGHYKTCLEGYVWREAFPGDLTCVTPDRRQQTADENAQAASLVNPSGAYGPDTCVAGYVWRDADVNNPTISPAPPDHVCVTPDVRDQVAYENLPTVAGERILQMLGGVVPNSAGSPFVTEGAGFNAGQVWVGIYRSADNSLIWGTTVTATLGGDTDFPDLYGFQGAQTPVYNCGSPDNAYITFYDYPSGVWDWSPQTIAVC